MFENLFERRDKKVASLLKLGACLGRSLRENVALFSVDSGSKRAIYVTESDKVISGKYSLEDDNISLTDLEVSDSALFQDGKKFDGLVRGKISNFVKSIHEDSYMEADSSFAEILNLWETRIKLDDVRERLSEKVANFNSSTEIIDSSEFGRLQEITPQLVTFLKESKEHIEDVSEIKNCVKLSNVVSTAFDFPRLSYEVLAEDGSYTVKDGINKSIYEMICQQELIKNELLESKKNFTTMWATNDKVRSLASMIFDSDEEVIAELAETIAQVPYLALTTKKQLRETVENSMNISEIESISGKDLQKFVGKLFEFKKPAKEAIISVLNEKYGINVQNLKEPPSFKSLLNTQVVIFEVLSKLSPKNSVQKEVLSEVATMLKAKKGVEGIDVNNYLQSLFEEATYDSFFNEDYLIQTLSFDEIVSNFNDSDNLKNLMLDQLSEVPVEEPETEVVQEEEATEEEVEVVEEAAVEKKTEEEPKAEAEAEEEPKAEAEEEPETEEEEKPMSKTEFLDNLKELEELLSGLTPEEDEEETEESEEEEEGEEENA